jgi:hypothetical protein
LSTVDLLVLASWDQPLFIFKILLDFFTKQATLTRRSTVLILSLKLVFPGEGKRPNLLKLCKLAQLGEWAIDWGL